MTRPRRTQQERRDQASAALLEAAAELVVEEGVRAVTLARVGERAGYSRGLVTHHFGGKKALLEQLARTTQTDFVPGLADLPPGLDRLLRLIDGYLAQLSEPDVRSRAFLVLWAESMTTPELAPIFRERDQSFRDDLREEIRAGITEGTIRADVDPEQIAVAIVGQLRGIALQCLLDPAAVEPAELCRCAAEVWKRALS
ncbi:TetR/AcrR family transcriptional regulator [Amycolatopsis sp. GA6-003]|uniref:TetR/AcrR family transcriptional regulator n=1 Tax=Amycolatopsis sp. GA6-003 TaxID=2652444 RepID=UPI0039174846